MPTTQKRIAIVGGGPAALSAAWEIEAVPAFVIQPDAQPAQVAARD